MVVAEIELCRVAVEMDFRDPMVGAGDPALEDAEIVFDRVRMPELSADILFGGMVDGTVAGELAPDPVIDGRVVGHNERSAADVGNDDRAQALCRDIGNMEGTH